jgi:hypothetical protein
MSRFLPVSHLLSSSVIAAVALGSMGCQQVQELVGMRKEEPAAEGGTAGADAPADGEKKPEVEPTPVVEENKPAVEAAKAELPQTAIVEPPPPAAPLVGLDALLALVPEGELKNGGVDGVFVLRDPKSVLDYADELQRFGDAPTSKIAAAAAKSPLLAAGADVAAGWAMFKTTASGTLGTIRNAPIDWGKGAILFEVGSDTYVAYASEKPDALKDLLVAFGEPSANAVCKAIDGQAPYAVCADDQAAIDKYKPGGEAQAKALRAAFSAKLPGQDLDAANLLGHAEDATLALSTPPGLIDLAVAIPNDGDIAEFKQTFKPGQPKTLRSVQPGAGFMWASLDIAKMKADPEGLGTMPPEFAGLVDKLSGEVLFAGHYEPSSLALQIGVTDAAAFAPVVDLAAQAKAAVPESLPDVKGSKVSFEETEVPLADGSKTKAIRVGLSGVPEADALAHVTGLTLDGWMFAANETLTFAIGASGEAIGRTAPPATQTPSAELMAYLPPSLSAALGKGEVSLVVHLPVDALQSPEMRKLVTAALKNSPDVPPEAIDAALSAFAPASGVTMWASHHGDVVVAHLAAQAIGHTADDEGKAALGAALAVAGGADPAATWGPLLTAYPTSRRLAAYKARAGQTQNALVASGVGAFAGAAALGYAMWGGTRNEAIVAEVGAEEGDAEVIAETSKLDPNVTVKEKEEAKKAAKKKKKASTDGGGSSDPKPEPKPEPEPSPGPKPDDAKKKGGYSILVPKDK